MFTAEQIYALLDAELNTAIRRAYETYWENKTNLLLYGFDPETGHIWTAPDPRSQPPYEGLDSHIQKPKP